MATVKITKIPDTPKVGMIVMDEKDCYSLVTAVDNKTKNFYVIGQWFPFSYFGKIYQFAGQL